MGYQVPDLCIYQVRWFDDCEVHQTNIRWTHWKTVEEWEYLSAIEAIKSGYKYQVRILKQIHIEGYCVKDEDHYPDVYVNPGI